MHMAEEEIKVVGTTVVKNEKKPNWKIIGAVIGIVVLALGVIAGIVLVRQQQDVREKAQTACVEQCPGSDGVLRNCTPPEADGSSDDSTCNLAGRIELCGGAQYCCPSAGGSWTTNLSLCPQSTPTSTATPTATPTATATSESLTQSGSTATATATATSTPTATATSTSSGSTPTSAATSTATATSTSVAQTGSTATPFPVPETGASWPTIFGMGAGMLIVIGSLFLAF